MLDPIPLLGEQGDDKAESLDLIPDARKVQLLFPQNQIHVLHEPPQLGSVTAPHSIFAKAEIIGPIWKKRWFQKPGQNVPPKVAVEQASIIRPSGVPKTSVLGTVGKCRNSQQHRLPNHLDAMAPVIPTGK